MVLSRDDEPLPTQGTSSASGNASLRSLTSRRAGFKGQLTSFKNYVDEFNEESDIFELRIRVGRMERILEKFDELQSEIEAAGQDDGEREVFERVYYQYMAKAARVLEVERLRSNLGSPSGANDLSQTQAGDNNTGVVKLPTLHLPTFSGGYDQWLEFYGSFRATIHENPKISEIQKLQYLRSSLKGEAVAVIEALPTIPGSYDNAWQLLRERYDNRRVIIETHVRLLFEMPAVGKDPSGLRNLVDQVQKHSRALKGLGLPTDHWGAPLSWSITSKLDRETIQEWDRLCTGTEMPEFEALLGFLKERCTHLESRRNRMSGAKQLAESTGQDALKRSTSGQSKIRAHALVGVGDADGKCAMCSGEHPMYKCEQFLARTPEQRAQAVRKLGTCYNCLRGSHLSWSCKASACRKCQKRHHTLLHREATDAEVTTSLPTTVPSQVIVSTALVLLGGEQGLERVCRVLLDSASQINSIRRGFVKDCGLEESPIDLTVSGFAAVRSKVDSYVTALVGSRFRDFSRRLRFMVVDKVTGKLPSQPIDLRGAKIDKGIQLADPGFTVPGEVDALIGAGIFYELLGNRKVPLNGRIVLRETTLGWIATGVAATSDAGMARCLISGAGRDESLTKFWELEEVPRGRVLSAQEEQCERHYVANVRRRASGQYEVRLPFNGKETRLGESRAYAEKRFAQLERRFTRNPELKALYTQFMDEYLNLGHMRLAAGEPGGGCYIPHHAVMKADSTTTKLRVVFDASARTSSGWSLNETLLVGPTVQDDIFAIVSRFRTHAFAMTADIEKMYRQVALHPDDCRYQKILWRDDVAEPIKTYELCTVTYGTASASFLATRTLKRLAEDERDRAPTASRIIDRDFYVDDLLTGANTVAKAIELRRQIIETTKRGGFHLRKWASNDARILEDSREGESDPQVRTVGDAKHKTLGLLWDPVKDTFAYRVKIDPVRMLTKRTMLSQVARIFDPLGLLGPVIVTAKLLIKALWEANVGWEDPVPGAIAGRYREFERDMDGLVDWAIPRCVMPKGTTRVELHGFADASERAYGACVYLKTWMGPETNGVLLVASKSWVAPAKTVTLPRLELCAAALLARLQKVVEEALQVNIGARHFWSDSTITLSWISTPPHALKTFVANRVAEIVSLTEGGDWKHVPSKDNPADCLSRGLTCREFLASELWVQGPEWLSRGESHWPEQPVCLGDPSELRSVTIAAVASVEPGIFDKYSDLTKLKHVVAFMLRFVSNCKASAAKLGQVEKGPLTIAEREGALRQLLRLMQSQEFPQELRALRSGSALRRGSPLRALSPFLDCDGLVRVGGRLSKAGISWGQAHPIVLAKKHVITRMLIKEVHLQQLHSGVNATLYGVRLHYWPIDGRTGIKSVLRKCVRCARAKPRAISYRMGQLPESRVTGGRPFETVGLDYCGPLYVKEKRHRNRGRVKAYVCLFVCFATKAVHVELVGDMTTESFLGCLRRFVARRGRPKVIYSDNGSNFVGAERALRAELRAQEQEGKIQEFLARRSIQWIFSPPRTPHFDGLWEAAVKSLKHHLSRTVGDTLFTSEELGTFLTEVEAILNSRPITPMSSDPEDCVALTPAHFLIGESLMTLPEESVLDIKANRLASWKHILQVRQRFWRRWQREYLSELNKLPKWLTGSCHEWKVGQMVILHDESAPTLCWKLGRIEEIHPGQDGVTRVVTVRTASGVFKRGVTKVSPLPIEEE